MSRKIKIIEVIWGIHDAGAETLLTNYVLGIDKSRFDVSVLVTDMPCSYTNSANVRKLVDNHVKIWSAYPIVTSSFFNKVYRKLRKWLIPRKIQTTRKESYVRNVILTQHPEIIHMHMQIGQIIDIADRLKGVKLLYSCYSIPSRYFNVKSEWNAAKYLISHNDLQLIAMHNEMREELNSMFNVDNTAIIRNAIDISAYRNVKGNKTEIRKKIGVPYDAFVVGHVGRMFYIKNQLYLIDIFKEIQKRKSNAFLLLVGDGEDKPKIIEKLEKYNLEGKYMILSNIDELGEIYRTMDVFIFPSLLEGLPNVCIEAQAAGLPCVISSSITKDVAATEHVIFADIAQSPQIWAELATQDSIIGAQMSKLSDFDQSNVIKNIEAIYLQ